MTNTQLLFLIPRCDVPVAVAKVKTVQVCYVFRRPFFGWRNSSLTIFNWNFNHDVPDFYWTRDYCADSKMTLGRPNAGRGSMI